MRIVAGNIHNKLAEFAYLNLGADFTRPIQVYGIVNTRCNTRCRMCSYWRGTDHVEKPAAVWKRALSSLKSFSPFCHINFSGGEPLMKRDFFEILSHCRNIGISAGVTTNGLLLNDRIIARILDSRPFNVNVSIDSMDPQTNDSLRGAPGSLHKVLGNIENLQGAITRSRSEVRIVIKPTVSAANLGGLSRIVEYARQSGLTGVNFQPINDWSPECKDLIEVERDSLNATIERLIAMKRDGYPVMNAEGALREWITHFGFSENRRSALRCSVAMRNLLIEANGDIILCAFYSNTAIGNIEHNNVREAWYSAKARKLRKTLVRCKKLCTATCVAKRSLRDYARLLGQFGRS